MNGSMDSRFGNVTLARARGPEQLRQVFNDTDAKTLW
jgi:hypothetical protein